MKVKLLNHGEIIVANEEIGHHEQLLLLLQCLQMMSNVQMRENGSASGKRLNC